ncbi:MAG: hypothetical protein SYC29_08205, partial [Planctomycetota bacterium]|nr:hypothetical protein [Planctomycetota bacterium]
MKVLVQCPNGHRFRCDEAHLGRSVRCPHEGCGVKFRLRALDEPTAADEHAPEGAAGTRIGHEAAIPAPDNVYA